MERGPIGAAFRFRDAPFPSRRAPGDHRSLGVALGNVDDDLNVVVVNGGTQPNHARFNDGNGLFGHTPTALGNHDTRAT